MLIERALALKPGDKVSCPDDRGNEGYRGTVVWKDSAVLTTSRQHGCVQYIWVTVEHPIRKTQHVWPSNRLG